MLEFTWFSFILGVLLSFVILILLFVLHKIFKQYSRNPPPKKCNVVNDIEASNIVLSGLESNGESLKQEEADLEVHEEMLKDAQAQAAELKEGVKNLQNILQG